MSKRQLYPSALYPSGDPLVQPNIMTAMSIMTSWSSTNIPFAWETQKSQNVVPPIVSVSKIRDVPENLEKELTQVGKRKIINIKGGQ